MNPALFERLHAENLITDDSLEKVKAKQSRQLFSVHWELKSLLYSGVLLLSSGLGIAVYKNIDSIGHVAILIFIAIVCAGGFYYCFLTKLPISWGQVKSPNSFFDYVLLLACLLFITFIGYWQYQYHIFGDRYGLVVFIPMLVMFFCAYYFDHLGVLSLGITNLAAWAGIVVSPSRILKENDFNSESIIITSVVLGIGLIVSCIFTRTKNLKPHFAFTYSNFGVHILFIGCLAGLFHFDRIYLLWFLVLGAVAFYFYSKSIKERSFYFLLIATIYSYIGLSYLILHVVLSTLNTDITGFYMACLYFIISGIGLTFFLIRMGKKIKII